MIRFTYSEIKKALEFIYTSKCVKTEVDEHDEIREFIRELRIENAKK